MYAEEKSQGGQFCIRWKIARGATFVTYYGECNSGSDIMVISTITGVLMQLPQFPVVMLPDFFAEWFRLVVNSRSCCLKSIVLLRATCTRIAVDLQLVLNGNKFLKKRLRGLEPLVRREGTLWRQYRFAVWCKAREAEQASKKARLLS